MAYVHVDRDLDLRELREGIYGREPLMMAQTKKGCTSIMTRNPDNLAIVQAALTRLDIKFTVHDGGFSFGAKCPHH